MSNIELNVVALGNFKGLQAELAALDKQIKAMNASLASNQAALTAKQLSGLSNAFHQAMLQSGQFTAKTVSMSTAAENLGQRLAKTKTGMNDYKNAMKSVSKETSLYNQLGQRQVAMQQSIVQNLGNGMARVYAQHNADLSNATTRSKVLTQAIIAQNTALMQGATKVINWGKNMQWAGRQLTAGLTMPVALLSAGLAKMYNDVDKNLTRMERVYGIGLEKPTKAMLESVRKDVLGLSKELGHQLGISATEVTDTAAQFAAAGLTGSQLLGATEQAARMVVLGETDKQEAIKATIALQTAYKMETKDLAEATNFFNAAQAATSTSMTDLIEAIPRTGPVIRGLGGTYKDMVAILTAMKEGGVPAGEAANAIKNSLGRIINPTKAAQERLGAFGIDLNSIVNRNAGNLVGTLTELQRGLDGLSSLDRQRAIAELFGKFQFARMAAFMDNFNKTGTQSAKVIEMMGLTASDLAGIAEEQTKKIQESASGKFKIAVEDLKNTLIPMGESALRMFTNLLEGLQDVFEFIQNLPGPIKSFIKIFGGIALIAGPVIMITGLFGNLIGQIGKGLVNLRTLGVSIITSGVNPLRTLGKQFRMTTEEMIAESNATQIFGSKMSAATGPIESVTLAINELILAMQRLNVTNVSGPLQDIQRTAGAMGASAGATRYQSELFNQQLTRDITGGGETTTVGRRSTTGSLLFPTGSSAADKQGKFKDTSLVYATDAQRKALMQKGKDLGISAQIIKQLIISEEEMLLLESRHLASLQIINQNDPKFIATYKNLQIEYQKELASAKTAAAKRQVNQKYQDQINALLAKQPNFASMVSTEMQRQKKALAEGVTHEQLMADNLKRATAESRLTATKVKGLNDAMDRTGWTLRAAAQNFVTKSVTMLGMATKGFSAERSHVIAAAAMDKALIAEGKLTQSTTNLAAKRTAAASSTFLGMPGMGAPGVGLTGAGRQTMSSGMQMGISGAGMVGSLAGGFMMGSENRAVAMGGQSLMAGGMAASMLPMLGASAAMTGGLTLIIAAIPLLLAGFNHLKTESEKTAAAIRGSMGAVTDDFKALGIEVSPLTNALPPFDEKIGVATDAVDQFVTAIEAASETSEMKAFADSLKDMTAEQKKAALSQKARSLAVGGADQAQVGTAIKGYMEYAGIFESVQPYIVSAFDEGGQVLSTTLTNAITGAFENSQTGLSASTMFGDNSEVGLSDSLKLMATGGAQGAIRDIASTLVPSLQGLIQNSDLYTLISQLDELAASPAFAEGTNGARALDAAIFKLTENSDDLNTLRQSLIAAGRSPQEQMIYLKAAINGLGGSIKNLPKLTTLQVKVLINQQEASAAAKGVFDDIASRSVGGDSSGSSGDGSGSGESAANKAIDKKIEKLKDTIDLIKEEQKERKRLLDLQQKEEDFAKTKMGIENQIREALSAGDFLKAAELKNELAVVEAKKSQTDAVDALDLADEKRIKELEDQIEELNKKKKSGSGGGGGSAIDEVKAQEDIAKKLQTSYDKTKILIEANGDLITSYGEFKTRKEVKDFIKIMEDNKATPEEIEKALGDMYASYTPTKEAIKGSKEFADSFDEKMKGVKEDAFSPQEWKNKSSLATAEALRGAQEEIDKGKLGINIDAKVDVLKYPHIRTSSGKIDYESEKELRKISNVAIQFFKMGGPVGYSMGGKINGYAVGGGAVSGPGGPTSDMIPAMLSNGEYVIKASSVSKYGAQMLNAINSGTFDIPKLKQPSFTMPGAPLGSSNMQGLAESMGTINNENTNNVTINADFNITGSADPKKIAEEVMQKIQITMKKSGTGNRI